MKQERLRDLQGSKKGSEQREAGDFGGPKKRTTS